MSCGLRFAVSACHGAGTDPLSPNCYPSKFFRWWNTVFPHPASELTNGAMRRTNSDYYSFCSSHHIPDVTDLIIIELDTDDDGWVLLCFPYALHCSACLCSHSTSLEHFEILVRSILTRQDHPAVLILGHFSPQVQREYGFAGPDHWHNVVAQFYDIPHIRYDPFPPPFALSPCGFVRPGEQGKNYSLICFSFQSFGLDFPATQILSD